MPARRNGNAAGTQISADGIGQARAAVYLPDHTGLKHGSILSDIFPQSRVSSQRKSTLNPIDRNL